MNGHETSERTLGGSGGTRTNDPERRGDGDPVACPRKTAVRRHAHLDVLTCASGLLSVGHLANGR